MKWILVALSTGAFAAERPDCSLPALSCNERCKEHDAPERRRECSAACAVEHGRCLTDAPPVTAPPPAEPEPVPEPAEPEPMIPDAPVAQVPSTRVAFRHTQGLGYDSYRNASVGDFSHGVRFFLAPLPEDPSQHRRAVEFLEHPSSIDLSLAGASVTLEGRLFLTRQTGLVLALSVPPQLPIFLAPRVGLVQYLGRSLLLEAHVGFGFLPEFPEDHRVTASVGTSILASARWLPSVWAHYTWGTRLRSSAVTVSIDNRFFLTPRLALGVELLGSITSPVEVLVSFSPMLETALRTSLHFQTKGSLEWEWNRWISTAVTLGWTWTRAGEFPPYWWVGPGLDVRLRF